MSERFTPSDLQAKAIREIKDWFLHRTGEQQVFRVFGYAGAARPPSPGTPSTSSASTPWPGAPTASCRLGRRAVRRLHRQGGAGHDPQGHARLHHPQPDLPRLGSAAEEIERVKQEIAEIKAKLPTLDPAVRLFEGRVFAASRSASTTSTSPASCSTSSRSCATRR